MRYWSLLFILVLGLVARSSESVSAQTWEKWPGCTSCKRLDYPLVYVSSRRIPSNDNGGSYGTDVLDVSAVTRGNKLEILLPNGSIKTLFPIPAVHNSIIDYPAWPPVLSPGNPPDPLEHNQMINGSVVEPSISIDGDWVYFSYFHDLVNFPCNIYGKSTFASDFRGWPTNADIYAINIRPLLDNYGVDPATLEVRRLTQTLDKFEHAQNPVAAEMTGFCKHTDHGVYNLSPVEMDTSTGRKLVFTSTRKRLSGSNEEMTFRNMNVNLFEADLVQAPELNIKNIRQFQYYTTTSALSPVRVRNGVAFSYQANTEEPRSWNMQMIDSEGRWSPLFGYGHGTDVPHLGAFCVKTTSGAQPAGDYFLSAYYYNQNNNGFGSIRAQNLSFVGQNRYNTTKGNGQFVPDQIGSFRFTEGVTEGDYPSANGKFTTPECGAPNEVFLAYSPTPSNHKDSQSDTYPAQLVFSSLEPVNLNLGNTGIQTVLRDSEGKFGVIWPKAAIDWHQRLYGTPHPSNQATQETAAAIISPDTPIAAGLPYAEIGTSALYNTDITGPECKYPGMPHYNPHQVAGDNDLNLVADNVDSLTWIQSDIPSNPTITDGSGNWVGTCKQPLPQHVFGVAIYLTSNKIDNEANGPVANWNQPGYKTDGHTGGVKESKRLLGVYDVRSQSDQSFKAIVPANVPFDLQLIHRDYGLKLADVRSWHSLKPREDRHDCGGCHNHKPGEAVSWNDKVAAQPGFTPLDMVNQTKRINYDVSCNPVLVSDSSPATDIPVWQDISPGFATHCGTCHSNNSTNSAAKLAFSYDPAELNNLSASSPVVVMRSKHYLDKWVGALSSPAFWAARGERTDGRGNDHPSYAPNHPSYSGYQYSPEHQSIGPRGQGLCDGNPANGPAAEWVYKFGLWIDNHMPVNVSGGSYDYHYDQYHPTVDGALTSSTCLPDQVRIGYWDDTGNIDRLEIFRNGSLLQAFNHSPPTLSLSNGSRLYNISAFSLSDSLGVKAIDFAGNIQEYSKTVAQLVLECQGSSSTGGGNESGVTGPNISSISPSPVIFNENLQSLSDGLYHVSLIGSNFTSTQNTTIQITNLADNSVTNWESFEVQTSELIDLRFNYIQGTTNILVQVGSLVGGQKYLSAPVQLTLIGNGEESTTPPDDGDQNLTQLLYDDISDILLQLKKLKLLDPDWSQQQKNAHNQKRTALIAAMNDVVALISNATSEQIDLLDESKDLLAVSVKAKKKGKSAAKLAKSGELELFNKAKKVARKEWQKILSQLAL